MWIKADFGLVEFDACAVEDCLIFRQSASTKRLSSSSQEIKLSFNDSIEGRVLLQIQVNSGGELDVHDKKKPTTGIADGGKC